MMRPVETTLPPARWTLEQILDLAELLLLFVAHPERETSRVGYLVPGRLVLERDEGGTPLSIALRGEPCRATPPPHAHCAPELRAGGAPELTGDLYLVGVVLYEVLSGAVFPPYARDAEPVHGLRIIPGLRQILLCCLNGRLRRDVASIPALLDAVAVARAESRPRMVHLEAAQMSQVGVSPARLRNQDATGIFLDHRIGASLPEAMGLLVLADGMGSTEGGALVAKRLVREAERAFSALRASEDIEGLYVHIAEHARRMSVEAIQATLTAMSDDPALSAGGSTWVAALIVRDRLAVTWLGDSRAYLLPAAGGMYALTCDHGLVGAAHAAGRMNAEALDANPFRHIIYRAVMKRVEEAIVDEELEDLGDIAPGEPFLTLSDGDRVVLMSDGVSGELEAAEMERMVRASAATHHAALALVEAAQASPTSSDNTSVVVARPRFTPSLDLPTFGPVGRQR